jgi:hypothetical protein
MEKARAGKNTLDSSFLLGSKIFELLEKQVLSKKARMEKSWTGGPLWCSLGTLAIRVGIATECTIQSQVDWSLLAMPFCYGKYSTQDCLTN